MVTCPFWLWKGILMIIIVLSFSLGTILGSFKTILEIIKLIIDIKKTSRH